MATYTITIDPLAERDLRRMGPGPERNRVRAALGRLADDDPSLDIKSIKGSPGWLRLRVGDHRVLFFHVAEDYRRLIVGRVPHRSELERAVAGLPKL